MKTILSMTSWLLLVGLLAVGRSAEPGVSPAVLDMAMETPVINTAPGSEYSDETRDYAMILGVERTPGGRFWAAWIAGGDSDLGYVVVTSSDDQGQSWSQPRVVIDPTDAPGLRRRSLVGNLWCDPKGRLWLFFDYSMGYFDGRGGVWAIVCDSPDAHTPEWSAPRRIWHGATLNKPTVLRSGEWLLPVSLWTRDKINPPVLRDLYHELDDLRMAHLFVSTDEGQTWARRGGVAVAKSDFDEQSLVERQDGSLWMLTRTTYGLAETVSYDRGQTWSSPQASPIQHVNARVFLRRLESGRLLLVKHGQRIDQRPRGRSDLTAFLSDDDGRTWQGGLVLDERSGVSYPDGFQAPDGTLFVAYDHNRAADREILLARFTEQDVLAKHPVSRQAQLRILVNKATGPKKAK